MTRLFRLDASIRREGSVTRALADIVEDHAGPAGFDVVRRDVGANPLPASVWPTVSMAGASGDQLSPEQSAQAAFARGLVDEATSADALILAVPLYNWGVSQHVKAWIDVLNTDPGLMSGDGALVGKPAVLVTARGGGYAPGTPREGWDHSTPYLRRIFGDLWRLDLTVIECELTLADVTPAMADLRDLAQRMLDDAKKAAAEAGSALSDRFAACAA